MLLLLLLLVPICWNCWFVVFGIPIGTKDCVCGCWKGGKLVFAGGCCCCGCCGMVGMRKGWNVFGIAGVVLVLVLVLFVVALAAAAAIMAAKNGAMALAILAKLLLGCCAAERNDVNIICMACCRTTSWFWFCGSCSCVGIVIGVGICIGTGCCCSGCGGGITPCCAMACIAICRKGCI